MLSILLALCLALSGFSAIAEAGNVFTASAPGFGGDITDVLWLTALCDFYICHEKDHSV